MNEFKGLTTLIIKPLLGCIEVIGVCLKSRRFTLSKLLLSFDRFLTTFSLGKITFGWSIQLITQAVPGIAAPQLFYYTVISSLAT